MKSPHPAAKPTDAQPADGAPYLQGVLRGLMDLAMEVAQAIHRRATASPAIGMDDVAAFERIARCVRRLVALAQRVAGAAPQPAPLPASRGLAARERTAREAEDGEAPERLERLEALECDPGCDDRLGSESDSESSSESDDESGPEFEDEFDDEFAGDIGQPVAAVIADICCELGLGPEWRSHPWERCTPEDIAALCAHAARPDPAGGPASPDDAPPDDAAPQATPQVASAVAPPVPPPLPCTGRSPPSPPGAGPEPPS